MTFEMIMSTLALALSVGTLVIVMKSHADICNCSVNFTRRLYKLEDLNDT